MVNARQGIEGLQAPPWNIPTWIDENGNPLARPVELSDYANKVLVILAFQSWCPGCHSSGFPTLQFLSREFAAEPGVEFLAIQTVFEGKHANTADKLLENQTKYGLKIPFGHDPGDPSTNDYPSVMYNYRTRGTPWVIIIDNNGVVQYNDFHIDPNVGRDLIRQLIKEPAAS